MLTVYISVAVTLFIIGLIIGTLIFIWDHLSYYNKEIDISDRMKLILIPMSISMLWPIIILYLLIEVIICIFLIVTGQL